ncbi:hypothetical protein [Synechococcus sp. PCC 7336]|uniref:hypothetical protein n=1 Tax=Synechococcus sp. PCC 7336 TaxID=195250 RepID=UPI0003479481|nr:hypothetical protein [Synechococcus sp. PCC 7336]
MLPLLPSRCPTPERDRERPQSNPPIGRTVPTHLQPRPVLSLNAGEQILLVELVQEATLSSPVAMVWVRPQLLVTRSPDSFEAISLPHTSDLLWPAIHFQPAYAEDVLQYWDRASDRSLEEAKQRLHQFLRRAWQIQQEAACQSA